MTNPAERVSWSPGGEMRVVGVQNYGASGTLFLHSLFDGHPAILSFPGLFGGDFYVFWNANSHLPCAELIDRYIEAHDFLFAPDQGMEAWGLTTLGPDMNETVTIDRDRFRSNMKSLLAGQSSVKRRDFLVATYLAYGRTAEKCRPAPDAHTILFPVHGQHKHFVDCLLEDFPDTRFVYMVRDPVQTFGSLLRHIVQERLPVGAVECAASQTLMDFTKHWGGWGHLCYGSRPYREAVRESCRAVRLEDIHRRPRETLESLCNWLEIPWNDCLLQSTFGGKKWWNRPQSPKLSGFGSVTIQARHREYMNAFDERRIRALSLVKCCVWQYETPDYAKRFLFRACLPLLLLLPFRAEWMLAWTRLVTTARELPEQGGRFIRRIRLPGATLATAMPLIPRLYDCAKPCFSFLLWIAAPVILAWDYAAARFWMLAAFCDQFRSTPREVALLPINAPASGATPS